MYICCALVGAIKDSVWIVKCGLKSSDQGWALFTARLLTVGFLLLRHDASSGWGWKERPPDLEGGCEYIE